MPFEPGTTFAGYVIERAIGAGGMGTVYVAHQSQLQRRVALKLLNEQLSADTDFRRRFTQEAILAARLSHPNIVSIHDQGQAQGQLWIAMQYVDGTDAAGALRAARGQLDPSRAVGIIEQIGSALDYAHRAGLVHRDVKPANMLLAHDDSERALLTDFGIAKAADLAGLTQTGGVVATFAYASPEQIDGRPVDGRSDQYSLACSAFELLTGARPFVGDSAASVMFAHMHKPPPSANALAPHLPPAVNDVLARAMAKNPAQRFATCAEFASALRQAITAPARTAVDYQTYEPTVVASRPLIVPHRSRRRPLLVGAVIAVVVALTAGLAVWKWPSDKGGGDTRADGFPIAQNTAAHFLIDKDGKTVERTATHAVDPAGDGRAECSGLSIAVGVSVVSTDGAGSISDGVFNGTSLAVRAHNAANPGCQVGLQNVDIAGAGGLPVASGAVTLISADTSIIGLVGPVFSTVAEQVGGQFDSAGLPFVTPSASRPGLTASHWDSFFQATTNDPAQVPAMAGYLKNVRRVAKVCVASDGSDVGNNQLRVMNERLGAVADTSCSGSGATVENIKRSAPDAVYFGGYTEPAKTLWRQLDVAGVRSLFTASDGVYTKDFDGDFTPGPAVVTCGCGPGSQDFTAAYAKEFRSQPPLWAVEAYDVATIMLTGIDSGAHDRAALTKFLRNYSGPGIVRDYRWTGPGELAEQNVWAYAVGK
ncbi:bifunctional serine/threonine-protein kinase/ABC transporter substrate-binding protein [Antrihabitans stalactiti]|uniref:bifunctional serine/threonine-protein kinase/ABC transporter substrate-binding protein n=1 Tax=Antrihabitans stalactiti TaxID=2584121 RepID=UPI00146E8E34|nr:bifunctional serine/threonine-protein kinase/ABC transporter substrate-binding protein [Antrihabitans stalactiti]